MSVKMTALGRARRMRTSADRQLIIAAIRKGYHCNELALNDEEHTRDLGEGVLKALDDAGFKVVPK